jgi:hypothetical protein
MAVMENISKLNELVSQWRKEARECLIESDYRSDPETVGKLLARCKTLISCADILEKAIFTLSMAEYLHINDVRLLMDDIMTCTRRACGLAVLKVDKSGAPAEILKRAYAACNLAKVNGPFLTELENNPIHLDFWNKVS